MPPVSLAGHNYDSVHANSDAHQSCYLSKFIMKKVTVEVLITHDPLELYA